MKPACAPLFSPLGLVMRGLLLAAPFVLLHLAGAQPCTSVLSGTPPAAVPALPREALAALGTAYAASYLVALLVAPVPALAGLIMAALQRLPVPNVTQRR